MSEMNAGAEQAPDENPIIYPDEPIAPKIKTNTVATTQSSTEDTVSRTMFNYVVVAATFLMVGIMIGGLTFGNNSGIDEVTLRRALNDAVAAAGGNESALVDMTLMADDDPYIGDEDAPIVIVEFSAYACPYCGRHFTETLEPLLENYGEHIRYVYRDFPIINTQISQPASLAANCANEQGRFWEYHDMIFNNQQSLGSPTFLLQAATELDLDMDAFTECLDEERYAGEVEGDYVDGILNNISGTPAFYVNGQFLSGALPYEVFERAVLLELDRLGIATDPA